MSTLNAAAPGASPCRAAAISEALVRRIAAPIFAKRLPEDGQQQIRGKLHPRSGTERTDVLDTTTKLPEQGLRAREQSGVAACEPDQRS